MTASAIRILAQEVRWLTKKRAELVDEIAANLTLDGLAQMRQLEIEREETEDALMLLRRDWVNRRRAAARRQTVA